jgi:H+/Cl- antiporter ClcA
VVAVVVLVIVFRALPGGVDLTFVPRSVDPGSPSALAQALLAGAVGGVLGLISSQVEARMRDLRLYDRAPVLVALAGGLVVAVLATPSFLVLFSGTEDMRLLFDGSQSPAALTYGAAAKWLAMMVVFATGWKGGPVFPLIFVAGALAVAASAGVGVVPVILYAGGIAGAATGALRSMAAGALVTLLVVPASLFTLILTGAAGAGVVPFAVSRVSGDTVPSDGEPRSG